MATIDELWSEVASEPPAAGISYPSAAAGLADPARAETKPATIDDLWDEVQSTVMVPGTLQAGHRQFDQSDPMTPGYQSPAQHEVGGSIPFRAIGAGRLLEQTFPEVGVLAPAARAVVSKIPLMTNRAVEMLDPRVTPEDLADPSRDDGYTRTRRAFENVGKLIPETQGEIDNPLRTKVVEGAVTSLSLPVIFATAGIPTALASIPTVATFALTATADALERNKRQGMSDAKARAEAYTEGASEAVWEYISDRALLGPLGKSVSKSAAKLISEGAAAVRAGKLDKLAFKTLLKGNLGTDFLKSFAMETGTELANTVTQGAAAAAYGVEGQRPIMEQLKETAAQAGGQAGVFGVVAAALGVKGARIARETISDPNVPAAERAEMVARVGNEMRAAGLEREANVLVPTWVAAINKGRAIDLESTGIDETDPRGQLPSPASLVARTAEIRANEEAKDRKTPAKPAGGPVVASTSTADLTDFLKQHAPAIYPEDLALVPKTELKPYQVKAQEEDAAVGLVTVFYRGAKGEELAGVSGGPAVSFVPADLPAADAAFKARHERGHALDARPELDPLTDETRTRIAQAVTGPDYAAKAQDLELRRVEAGLPQATPAEEFDELVQDVRGDAYGVRGKTAADQRSSIDNWVASVAEAEPGRFQRLKETLATYVRKVGIPVAIPDRTRGTAEQWGAVADAVVAELGAAKTIPQKAAARLVVNILNEIETRMAPAAPGNKQRVKDVVTPSTKFGKRKAAEARDFARGKGGFKVGEILRHNFDGEKYRVVEIVDDQHVRLQHGKQGYPVVVPVVNLSRVPGPKNPGATVRPQKSQTPPVAAPAAGRPAARVELEDRARVLGVQDPGEMSDRVLADAVAARIQQKRPAGGLIRRTRNPDGTETITPVRPPQPPAPPAAPRSAPAPARGTPESGKDAPAPPTAAADGPKRERLVRPAPAPDGLEPGGALAKTERVLANGNYLAIVDRSGAGGKFPKGGIVVQQYRNHQAEGSPRHMSTTEAKKLRHFTEDDLVDISNAMDAEEGVKTGEVRSLIGEIKRNGGSRIDQDTLRDHRGGWMKDAQNVPGLFVHKKTSSDSSVMAEVLGYESTDAMMDALRAELDSGRPQYYGGVKGEASYSLPGKPIELRYAEGSTMAKLEARKFVGRPLVNLGSGLSATISGESLGEMLNPGIVGRSVSPQAHMTAVANLDHLFPISVLRGSRSDKKIGQGIKQIHHFEVPMPFNGELLNVRIMAKEFEMKEQGTRLYLVRAVEITKPAFVRGDLSSPSHSASTVSVPNAGFDTQYSELLDAVKSGKVFTGVDVTKPEDKAPLFSLPQQQRRLFRGERDGQGSGIYRYGKALYVTTNRKYAAGYGEVKEAAVEWPKNPLVIGRSTSFDDWLLEKSGAKNLREFHAQHPDPGEFVRSQGYDGVVDADVVVIYSPKPKRAAPLSLAGPKGMKRLGRDPEFSALWDRKPRVEINDSAAEVNLKELDRLAATADESDLASVIRHHYLFTAYPELRYVKVRVDRSSRRSYSTDDSIMIGETSDDREVLLHEIQHLIQAREGLARGGSPDEFIRGYSAIVKDLNEQIDTINSRLRAAAGTPKYNELLDDRSYLVKELRKVEGKDGIGHIEKGHADYRRLAGEFEARDTEARANLIPRERKERPVYGIEPELGGADQLTARFSLPSSRSRVTATPARDNPAAARRLSSSWRDRGLSVLHAAEYALKYLPSGGRPTEDILANTPEGAQYLQRVERAWWGAKQRTARWNHQLTKARRDMDKDDRKYLQTQFLRDYEEGGADQHWRSPAVAQFAEAWAKVNEEIGQEAQQAHIPSLSGGRQGEFRMRDPGTYVPHRLTDEAETILHRMNGPGWEALLEAAKVKGIDTRVLLELRQNPITRARNGSLEYARIAELPWTIEVDGREVQILEKDPAVLFAHIRNAARTLATVEQFGLDEASSEYLQEVANDLVKAGADRLVTPEAIARIWSRLQGRDVENIKDALGKLYPYYNALESTVAALNLSGAVVGNLIGGHLPESVRMGLVPTFRAFWQAYTTSLKDGGLDQLHNLVDLEGDLLAGLQMTEGIEGTGKAFATKVLTGTGFVDANRRINMAVALAMQRTNMKAMLTAIRTGKDTGKLWGQDAGAARRYLTEELRFSDKETTDPVTGEVIPGDLERMLLEGPTDEDMARAIGKELELVNAMNESPASRPQFVAHPIWRMAFAYSTFVRKMYDTTKYAAREAKAGNARPMATLLVAGTLTGAAIQAIRNALWDREKEEKGFIERFAELMAGVGAFGMFSGMGYALGRYEDDRGPDAWKNFINVPIVSTPLKIAGGAIDAAKGMDVRPLWKGLTYTTSAASLVDRNVTRLGLLGKETQTREYADQLANKVYLEDANERTDKRTKRLIPSHQALDPIPSKERDASSKKLVARLRKSMDDQAIVDEIRAARDRRAGIQ